MTGFTVGCAAIVDFVAEGVAYGALTDNDQKNKPFGSLAMAPTLLRVWCLLQSLSERYLCRLDHINYRSSLIERFGRPLVPDRSARVHGDVIPYDVPAIMGSDRMRNQPSLVPELGGTTIGNAR